MLKTLAAVAIGLALLTGIGSATAADAPVKASKKYTIAVIPKGTTHEYWKTVHAGAQQAAEDLGVDIIWKGPLKEDDREDQIKIVENMVNRGVDGIVLAPLDESALKAPTEAAIAAGKPVVIFDSALKSKKMSSFVATDNEAGGKIAGQQLAKLLDNKGKVIMLRYAEGSASTAAREKGFLEAIKAANEAGAKLEIVSENQYGGSTSDTAMSVSERLIAKFKNADGTLGVDGIFACNESTTHGMLLALEDTKLAGKVKLVGFDSSEPLNKALKAGKLNATVVQNPYNMGYQAVVQIVNVLDNRTVTARVDTGAALVTPDNMNDAAIQTILNPDLSHLKE